MKSPVTAMNTAQLSSITIATADQRTAARVVPERGAIVTSLMVGGREILYLDESTLLDQTKNVRGGVPVLFPSPGKLLNDTWAQCGKSGALKQHGLARLRAWSIADRRPDRLVLRLSADAATLPSYPWRFAAELEFALSSDRLRIAMTIQNDDDSTMPYALGFHPYFCVANKSTARIATKATQVFNNVNRSIEPFRGFDFAQSELDLHLLDHGSAECVLSADDGDVIVRASDDFGVWVIWSLAEKPFICVEPWSAMGNALNSGERLTLLESGQRKTSWMEIAFRQR